MTIQANRGQKIRSFLRENPLPALALLGLLIGGVARMAPASPPKPPILCCW